MRVYALWYGGPSYGAPEIVDREEFKSLASARRAYESRAEFDPYYPCVEESEMQIFKSDPAKSTDPYPDLVLTMGPRGGVRVSKG